MIWSAIILYIGFVYMRVSYQMSQFATIIFYKTRLTIIENKIE